MGMESLIWIHPISHLFLRICRIIEILRTGIDIGQRNYVVGVWIRPSQKSVDTTSKLLLLGNSAVVFAGDQPGHPAGESNAEEVSNAPEKNLFSLAFDQNGYLHP
jgi:hypothetical protein